MAMKSTDSETMFGVLVDVSGSMKSAYALDRSTATHQVSVEGTHAVFTSVLSVVKRTVERRGRQDSIFVGAFGLQNLQVGSESIDTCDLLFLLDSVDSLKVDGHRELTRLAYEHNCQHANQWICKHLTKFEACILYSVLQTNRGLTRQLVNKIPSNLEVQAASGISFMNRATFGLVGRSEDRMVHDSEAYKFARIQIEKKLEPFQHPKPRPIQEVSRMMDKLLDNSTPHQCSAGSTLHDKIQELVEHITPYIYGGTPMCKAIKDAKSVFSKTYGSSKVLFILSDGQASDGDPRPIAGKLRDSGVKIATCFLTSENLDNPKCLYGPSWSFENNTGKQKLLEMSSITSNTEPPLSYLPDAGWELPSCGKSRLFVQANTLDVVNEFCRIVVSYMDKVE